MGYYGVDWVGRLIIAWAIWNLESHPRRAYAAFMVANLFSIIVACLASPTIWGAIAGDAVFMLMHLRNIRRSRHAA